MTVLRKTPTHLLEKDIGRRRRRSGDDGPAGAGAAPALRSASIGAALAEVEAARGAVVCLPRDYPAATRIAPHRHGRHQLIHAVAGVMVVSVADGQWVVPPSRALWMPAGLDHAIDCAGELRMRSVYVEPGAAPGLPREVGVVGVSPLLRALIEAAMTVPQPYRPNSRDGRLMRLLLDELKTLPLLPLHLPQPVDPRLRRICDRLQGRPDDPTTLADWGRALGIDSKTVARLFVRDTGMTFGHWRQQLRLLRALERLAGGDRIVNIALDLGYDSPGAFSTMFRRHFGLPPSRFFEPSRRDGAGLADTEPEPTPMRPSRPLPRPSTPTPTPTPTPMSPSTTRPERARRAKGSR